MSEVKIKARGKISLAEKCPELTKEWDYDKNEKSPEEYSYGSNKKVWWICKHGHNWEATICNRTKGKGCPVCSGRKVLTGINDLSSISPVLTSEWHQSKNYNLLPTEVKVGSNKKVWWQCKFNHEWKETINNRYAKKTGCPFCSGHRVLSGFNDLATVYPEIASEWNYTKNQNLIPTKVTARSDRKVWWECKAGHEWETTISNRTINKTSCPYCSGRKVITGTNDLKTLNPKLIEEWNYNKNGTLKPEYCSEYTNKKVWWKCGLGHEWVASISHRKKGNNCPYCCNKKILQGYNDLKTHYPKLASQWCSDLNGTLKPNDVSYGSGKQVWWKCDLGHEWKTSISHRSQGEGCPYCSNKKVLVGYNDLATTHPNVAAEWNREKNRNMPTEFIAGSYKKVWWIAKCGHEWYTSIENRTVKKTGCPICDKTKKTSIPEKIVFYYLKKIFPHTKCNYYPVWLNGKEIDVYIPELDFSYEYDGPLHDLEKDKSKDEIFKKLKKIIVRSRVPGLPQLYDNSICFYIEKVSNDYTYMNDEVKKIISIINEIYDLDIIIDIDVVRDMGEILELIEFIKLNNSIVNTEPTLASQWNYTKNIKLIPEYFTKGSNKKVWWICPQCNHEWKAKISSRTQGCGCPECGKKKMIKTRNENKLKKMQYIEKTAKAS